jgi:hypothetical protein
MGMGDDCPTPGCGQLAAHPGQCRARLVEASQVGDTSDALTPLQSGGAVPLDRGQSEAKLACPTRNCRRTDEHDAKGCVVAWQTVRSVAKPCGRAGCTLSMVDGRITCQCTEVGGLVFVGPLPDCYPVLAVNVEHVVQDPPDRAYFMSPGFKP